jgi:signal recognition particle subunit SRP54
MADIMKSMAGKGIRERMQQVQQLQKRGMLDPGGMLNRQKKGTGKRLTSQEKAKLRKLREKDARRKAREQKKDRRQG